MSVDRQPTPVAAVSVLTKGELVTQLRYRIEDLRVAPNAFARDIHAGVAMMLLDEIVGRIP